ncbi:MAG TPA: hypothetical protein DFR83_04960 [Deltaproteobacteria bacterium]|nr:hypothetical protein [Deltaproteobacteria bacterium]
MLGARRSPRLALGFVGGFVVLVCFVAARVAAPHQFPYLLTLLPPLALCVAAVPKAAWIFVPLALVQAGWQLAFDGRRVQDLATDVSAESRAVDVALGALAVPWTCPGTTLEPGCAGDALVLLRPPGRNDDDKTRTSAVLWRIRPWWSAPRIQLPEVPLGSNDHRHGQPRLVNLAGGPFAIYVHDQVRPTLSEVYGRHRAVWLVVSDVGPQSSMLESAVEMVGREAQPVGADFLIR